MTQETTTEFAEPQLTFAFEARVSVAAEQHIGRGPNERLTLIPITGGTVSGPRLNGTVLGIGADWCTERGTTYELEARYVIEADDGALIDIINRGFYREIDGYYRTSPMFRTDASAHRWLTETVFIGMARPDGDQVCIRFFELE